MATALFAGAAPGSSSARQTAADRWPQYGYDPANTGRTAGGSEPRDDTRVDQQWAIREVGELEDGRTQSGLAVVGDTIYVGTISFGQGGEVLAYPITGGEPRWRIETTGRVRWTPAVGDGTVYATDSPADREQPDEGGSLYAIDAETGAIDWAVETTGTNLSGPILVDGTVVFTATTFERQELQGSRIYAVSAADGTIEWTVRHDGMDATTPAVADGTAYVPLNPSTTGSDPGTLYAYDLATGSERIVTEFSYGIAAPPTVDDGTVYVGVADSLDDVGRLHAVDIESGESRWTYDAERDFAWGVAVAEGTVVLSSDRVEAIDVETGQRRWEFRTDFLPGPPTIAGDTVYVQRDRVYAIDLEDGADLWNSTTGSASVRPAVVGDTLYTVGYNDLYAFSETSVTTAAPPGETLDEQTDVRQDPRGGDPDGDGPILELLGDSTAGVGLLSGVAGLLLGAGTAAYRNRSKGQQDNRRPPGGGRP